MLLWTCVLFVLSVNIFAQGHEYRQTGGAHITYWNGHRLRRSPLAVGKAAIDMVLHGARFIYSNGLDKVFVKPGGFKAALEDFDSINIGGRLTREEKGLLFRKIIPPEKVGKNGDKTLVLDHDVKTGTASLSIYQLPRFYDPAREVGTRIIVYSD